MGETITLEPRNSSPAQRSDRWFSQWDSSPMDGYVGTRNYAKRTASFTPELPGIYQFILYPIDDRTYGFPDTLRVVVRPAR